MLTETTDGFIRLRDVELDPIHVRALGELGYVAPGEGSDEAAVVKGLREFVARATFEKVAELHEDRPVKLRPDRQTLRLLAVYGWIDLETADHEDITAAIDNLITFALFRRLNAADAAREAAISRLIAERAGDDRLKPVTGAAAQARNDAKSYLRAAE